MKLQKLLYYSQAWSLVWDDRALFEARLEAWANGPVVPEIYQWHRGQYQVHNWKKGDSSKLDGTAVETIDAVVDHYNKYSTQELSDLTHKESPWQEARGGLPDGVRGSNEISHASMAEYYSSL